MAAGIISLLVTLAGIAAVLVNAYLAASPERKKEKRDEEVTVLRTAIAAGDDSAVSGAVDRLCSAAPGTGVAPDGKAATGPAGPESGVADLGQRVDDIAGAC